MIKKSERKGGLTDPQTWVDAYGNQLFRYAFSRVQNRMAAEELVQETFLAALTGGDGFEGRSSEKTWLTAILKHKIIDHFRKSGREQPMNQSQNQENQTDHFFHENGSWKDEPERWDIAPDQILQRQMLFIREAMRRFSLENVTQDSDGLLSPEAQDRINLSLRQK